MHQEVLDFWFHEIESKQWWVVDTAFDALIQQRFGILLEQARHAELFAWRAEPLGRLAEIIVLDQFSRNVYRNSPLAFAQDAMALVLAQEAVANDTFRSLSETECGFLLMPYMHSESQAIHQQGESLFAEFAQKNTHEFELKHKKIIDQFGRYPHRNMILDRTSTVEEIAFLKQPDSSF